MATKPKTRTYITFADSDPSATITEHLRRAGVLSVRSKEHNAVMPPSVIETKLGGIRGRDALITVQCPDPPPHQQLWADTQLRRLESFEVAAVAWQENTATHHCKPLGETCWTAERRRQYAGDSR